MSRFYFDVHDGVDLIDDLGVDLVDLRQAQLEAVRLAAGLLRDEPCHLLDEAELEIAIRAGGPRRLSTLRIRAELVHGDPWLSAPEPGCEEGEPCATS